MPNQVKQPLGKFQSGVYHNPSDDIYVISQNHTVEFLASNHAEKQRSQQLGNV